MHLKGSANDLCTLTLIPLKPKYDVSHGRSRKKSYRKRIFS